MQPTSATRTALAVAIGTRALFFPLAWIAAWLLASGTGPLRSDALDLWRRWDAAILLRIAEHGYTPAADPNPEAFFPLFPLLVRLLSVAMTPLVAGVVVSAVASVVAFSYLYRLAEMDAGPGAGRRAVLYLAFFPTAVFLVAPYTEALFLAGAIAAFYYARRGAWLHVALPAAVATGARFAGVFLALGLAVEFLRARDRAPRRLAHGAVALAAAIAPLLAFMVFLARAHGTPFAFVVAQREGWGRRYVGPIDAFWTTWNTNAPGYPTNWIFAWKVEILAAAIGVAVLVVALRKREWGYATYMGATMAILLTSSWYYSIPRMLLSLFPIVVFLAARTQRRPHEHEPVLLAFAVVATLGVVVFTRGAWFF